MCVPFQKTVSALRNVSHIFAHAAFWTTISALSIPQKKQQRFCNHLKLLAQIYMAFLQSFFGRAQQSFAATTAAETLPPPPASSSSIATTVDSNSGGDVLDTSPDYSPSSDPKTHAPSPTAAQLSPNLTPPPTTDGGGAPDDNHRDDEEKTVADIAATAAPPPPQSCCPDLPLTTRLATMRTSESPGDGGDPLAALCLSGGSATVDDDAHPNVSVIADDDEPPPCRPPPMPFNRGPFATIGGGVAAPTPGAAAAPASCCGGGAGGFMSSYSYANPPPLPPMLHHPPQYPVSARIAEALGCCHPWLQQYREMDPADPAGYPSFAISMLSRGDTTKLQRADMPTPCPPIFGDTNHLDRILRIAFVNTAGSHYDSMPLFLGRGIPTIVIPVTAETPLSGGGRIVDDQTNNASSITSQGLIAGIAALTAAARLFGTKHFDLVPICSTVFGDDTEAKRRGSAILLVALAALHVGDGTVTMYGYDWPSRAVFEAIRLFLGNENVPTLQADNPRVDTDVAFGGIIAGGRLSFSVSPSMSVDPAVVPPAIIAALLASTITANPTNPSRWLLPNLITSSSDGLRHRRVVTIPSVQFSTMTAGRFLNLAFGGYASDSPALGNFVVPVVANVRSQQQVPAVVVIADGIAKHARRDAMPPPPPDPATTTTMETPARRSIWEPPCKFDDSFTHSTATHICGVCTAASRRGRAHAGRTCYDDPCALCRTSGHTASEHNCATCGETGHLTRVCPDRPPPPPAASASAPMPPTPASASAPPPPPPLVVTEDHVRELHASIRYTVRSVNDELSEVCGSTTPMICEKIHAAIEKMPEPLRTIIRVGGIEAFVAAKTIVVATNTSFADLNAKLLSSRRRLMAILAGFHNSSITTSSKRWDPAISVVELQRHLALFPDPVVAAFHALIASTAMEATGIAAGGCIQQYLTGAGTPGNTDGDFAANAAALASSSTSAPDVVDRDGPISTGFSDIPSRESTNNTARGLADAVVLRPDGTTTTIKQVMLMTPGGFGASTQRHHPHHTLASPTTARGGGPAAAVRTAVQAWPPVPPPPQSQLVDSVAAATAQALLGQKRPRPPQPPAAGKE